MAGMKLSSVLLSCLASTIFMVGSPAFAAEEAAAEAGSPGDDNRTLDMTGLVIPVSDSEGHLINYLFVSVLITLSEGVDHWDVREHGHVYRDLVLKEAHRTNVGIATDPMKLNKEEFEALIHRVFDKELGAHSVKALQIMGVDSQKLFVDG